MSKKSLIFNEPGWELMQKYTAPMTIKDIENLSVNKIAGSGVDIYQMCLLTGHVAAVHRSKILDDYCSLFERPHKMHMWRLRETMKSLSEQGTDVLQIVSRRCRELGIECHASIRVNDAHHTYITELPEVNTDAQTESPEVNTDAQANVKSSLKGIKFIHKYYFPDLRTPWLEENKHLWLSNGGALDYSKKAVREQKLEMIKEVLENYEIDGIDLDFTRFRPFFENDCKDKLKIMTLWIEDVRKVIDLKSKEKGNKIKLTARVEYEPEVNLDAGLDVEAWIFKGLLDIVCLGVIGDATPDASAKWFIDLCRGSGCKVYPGLEGFFYWIGKDCGTMRNMSIENARAAASCYYHEGADGIQLYNVPACDAPWDRRLVEELAYPEQFELKDKHYVYTLWDGAIMCKNTKWDSRFVLLNDVNSVSYKIVVGDDIEKNRNHGIKYYAILKTRIDGLNSKDDIEMSINGKKIKAREVTFNQFAWDSFSVDNIEWDIPSDALIKGENIVTIKRMINYKNYSGHIEVQEMELLISYPKDIRNTSMQ